MHPIRWPLDLPLMVWLPASPPCWPPAWLLSAGNSCHLPALGQLTVGCGVSAGHLPRHLVDPVLSHPQLVRELRLVPELFSHHALGPISYWFILNPMTKRVLCRNILKTPGSGYLVTSVSLFFCHTIIIPGVFVFFFFFGTLHLVMLNFFLKLLTLSLHSITLDFWNDNSTCTQRHILTHAYLPSTSSSVGLPVAPTWWSHQPEARRRAVALMVSSPLQSLDTGRDKQFGLPPTVSAWRASGGCT